MAGKRQAPSSMSSENQPRATAIPAASKKFKNSEKKFHNYREFLVDSDRFMEHHKSIDFITLALPNVFSMKAPSTADLERLKASQSLVDATFSSATRVTSDSIFSDLQGSPFLFYVRQSLSPADVRQLTFATKTFCRVQKPSSKHNGLLDASARYKLPQHEPLTPAIYDFTSVELGHGNKGIQLSQEVLNCVTHQGHANYSDFNKATMPALRAASIMYFYLARNCDKSAKDIHEDFIKLANATYEKSNDFVKVMLGKPWSPFAQRRLVCNLNSRPHIDGTNERLSLNSLTFYGKANLWLVVIISGQSYAFQVVAGATLLFPASLFIHFTAGWEDGERFVLTNWTSNQLGYRAILNA